MNTPTDSVHSDNSCDENAALQGEVDRLKRIVNVLMDRAERHINKQTSGYNLFDTVNFLESKIRSRTTELNNLLRENEKINRMLSASEEKYKAIVNQSLTGYCIYADGRPLFANERLAQITGHETAELSRIDLRSLFTEESFHRLALRVQRTTLGDKANEGHIYEIICNDNRKKHVEISISRIHIENKLHLLFSCIDITAKVRAEKESRDLHSRLRELSIRDELTGLFNRRYMNERLANDLETAKEKNHSVSVLIADIDHFKNINDSHGHQAGDRVLREIGETLTRHARVDDFCCRYGGEEFILAYPGMDRTTALVRAEEIRTAILSHRYLSGRLSVTASFGISAFPECADTAEKLIESADEALYQAKNSGRNSVCVAPPSSDATA